MSCQFVYLSIQIVQHPAAKCNTLFTLFSMDFFLNQPPFSCPKRQFLYTKGDQKPPQRQPNKGTGGKPAPFLRFIRKIHKLYFGFLNKNGNFFTNSAD